METYFLNCLEHQSHRIRNKNSPCTANYALHFLDEPNGNGKMLRIENSTSGYLQKMSSEVFVPCLQSLRPKILLSRVLKCKKPVWKGKKDKTNVHFLSATSLRFTPLREQTRMENLISRLFRTSVTQNSKQNSPCTANYALYSLDEPNGNGKSFEPKILLLAISKNEF
ncbi:hypothetical protein CEXT_743251 [Caerostris extrusa]|uniref:Uncharacterized protein n=1 Tax=Caerostris extrusa TaxID=172846 RepID=A0AAV4VT74_CAEEX|nr:hypothetical protein CEXT_743251 [Caerostris extrusa]